jgi:hypothetical protein
MPTKPVNPSHPEDVTANSGEASAAVISDVARSADAAVHGDIKEAVTAAGNAVAHIAQTAGHLIEGN